MKQLLTQSLRPANGTERAALVLLALGETHGGPIWNQFDDTEIAALGDAMARLGTVEAGHVGAALSVFASELSAAGGFIGTPGAAESLLAKVLPEERATLAVERMRRPGGPGLWEQLAKLDDAVIAGYLAGEHPQTTALVLSRLAPQRAASIVSKLDREAAIAALSRLARLDDVDRHALAALEQALAQNLVAPHSGPEKADPALRIASIFDAIDQRDATLLLERWNEMEAEVAGRVRGLMFTFEDFIDTPAASIQILLRGLDRDVLALALKGASTEVRARFLEQMSARAARMMEDQITSRGPVRRKDVSAAQSKVIAAARELEATEEIKLRAPVAGGPVEDMVE